MTQFRNKGLDKLKEQIVKEYDYNATDCRVELYVSPTESSPSTGYSQHD